MEQNRPVIALMTDFGLRDTYVGVMKAVIVRIAPHAFLLDLTHDLPPQDITAASFHLAVAVPYLPPSAVVCCIVDPGVGSSRRPVVVQTEHHVFVAPDNGLLTPVLRSASVLRCAVADRTSLHLPQPSATFHGRDVFAPVAARLATGLPLDEVGTPLAPDLLVQLDASVPERVPGGVQGRVVVIDYFGNLITDLTAGDCTPAPQSIAVAGIVIPALSRTFADVQPGEPVAYIGSSGRLELAVNCGNAARQWGVQPGEPVVVQLAETL